MLPIAPAFPHVSSGSRRRGRVWSQWCCSRAVGAVSGDVVRLRGGVLTLWIPTSQASPLSLSPLHYSHQHPQSPHKPWLAAAGAGSGSMLLFESCRRRRWHLWHQALSASLVSSIVGVVGVTHRWCHPSGAPSSPSQGCR
jgi:hypothetical protein